MKNNSQRKIEMENEKISAATVSRWAVCSATDKEQMRTEKRKLRL